MKRSAWLIAAGLLWQGTGVAAGSEDGEVPIVKIVHLGAPGGDKAGLLALKAEFESHNPGYALWFEADASGVAAAGYAQVVFVQRGEATATVQSEGADSLSDVGVGDLVLLRPGEALSSDRPMDLLTFGTPEPLPPNLPSFIRPDWDEHITDTPGGCATETGAYRRVCLTWLREKRAYNFHSLNAHRVRIMDSFSHYHPLEGGFDEFYLVQMVQPGARIIVSHQTGAIVDERGVTRESAAGLLHEYELAVGDLVYLPRGVMHRGVGGVLAQVITTPGFVPGAEIGVDHHLRAIDERLGLEGDDALPYNAEASAGPVVR